VPPMIESVYNVITRRIRAAHTIFGDRVKLVLRQVEDSHWSKLQKPYLLVIPRQTRNPREVDVDYMSFVNPREVTFIAQFDGRGSEQEYQAANDIDTAELQLITVLAKWEPFTNYKPTTYGGLRIQATRAPDVKVAYTFLFNEVQVIQEALVVDDDDLPDEVELDTISVRMIDPCCVVAEEETQGPKICVEEGGGCPEEPEPDPCAPPECPPILGGNDASTDAT